MEDADRKRTWLADADEALSRGAVVTARAILAAATAALPTKKSVWRKAAELERAHGEPGAVDALLKKAVTFCPQVRGKRVFVGGTHCATTSTAAAQGRKKGGNRLLIHAQPCAAWPLAFLFFVARDQQPTALKRRLA